MRWRKSYKIKLPYTGKSKTRIKVKTRQKKTVYSAFYARENFEVWREKTHRMRIDLLWTFNIALCAAVRNDGFQFDFHEIWWWIAHTGRERERERMWEEENKKVWLLTLRIQFMKSSIKWKHCVPQQYTHQKKSYPLNPMGWLAWLITQPISTKQYIRFSIYNVSQTKLPATHYYMLSIHSCTTDRFPIRFRMENENWFALRAKKRVENKAAETSDRITLDSLHCFHYCPEEYRFWHNTGCICWVFLDFLSLSLSSPFASSPDSIYDSRKFECSIFGWIYGTLSF